jgi:hypothetical protein
MPATPYDQSQDFDFNIGLAPPETTCLEQSMSSPPCAFSYENTFDMPEPPPDITCLEQNMFSPSSAFPYEYTFDKSETPPLPPSDTSHGNGYGDFAPSEPVPNWQVLGMSLDVPSEIERTNPHVSLIRSHAYAYDFGEETSELVRDLFPGLQNQHTF